MNRLTTTIAAAQDAVNEAGARALVVATNVTGKLMTTRVGKAALVLPMAVYSCTITASAADVDANGMLSAIMGVLKPGVVALGSLIAVVGGVQLGVGFKDDNADGKTRGFQTLIGGAIVAAVGGVIPESLTIGS